MTGAAPTTVRPDADRPPAWTRWWWTLPAALGAVVAGLMLLVLPPDRTLDNVGEVFLRLSPVLLAVVAVAGFPRHPGFGMVALGVLVVVYMGGVDTQNVLHVDEYAATGGSEEAFPAYYRFAIFLNAFTVLAVLFAYRLGGAGTARVLKVGVAAVLVVVSGLNDLSFWYLNDWRDGRPRTLSWASHIAVFVGGPPTALTAALFCLVHLALAGVVLALPVQRWLDALALRVGARSAGPR